MTTPKKHYATRDFRDAGTERNFTKGAELTDLSEGAIGNYAAAGLASTEKPGAADAASPKTSGGKAD